MIPTVYVVEDDLSIRRFIERIVDELGYRCQSFAEASEFLQRFRPDHPCCVVLDIILPGATGLEALETLRQRGIQSPVLMMSAHADVPAVLRAMKAGALDIVEKPLRRHAMKDRIHTAVRQDLARHGRHQQRQELRQRVRSLTPRETEVAELVVLGKSNREIAAELGISRKTVEQHRAHIKVKMRSDSLAHLVRLMLEANRNEREMAC